VLDTDGVPWPFVVLIDQVILKAEREEHTFQFCWLIYNISSDDDHETNCHLEQLRTLSPLPHFSVNADKRRSEIILVSVLPCRIRGSRSCTESCGRTNWFRLVEGK